jgi:hypothetical protein
VWLDVQELVFDDMNEAKFADHATTIVDVLDVLDVEPRSPIEDWGGGVWRPVTAFDANAWQVRRYRSSI